MIARNYEKLLEEYKQRFGNAPNRCQRGQIFLTDYSRVLQMAKGRTKGLDPESVAFEAISIALEAGIMIGYKACQADAREKKR